MHVVAPWLQCRASLGQERQSTTPQLSDHEKFSRQKRSNASCLGVGREQTGKVWHAYCLSGVKQVEGGMAAVVVPICPMERVWLDPRRIGLLYAQLGGAEVQAILDRAMIELVTTRDELQTQYHEQDAGGLTRNLRRLRRIAEHLGLQSLVTIAQDVADCAERADQIAFAATWARLNRSIDRAVAGAWESCRS
jgi:hypothetical protein